MFERKIVIIFLPINLSICSGCYLDASFEYPQHMFWLRKTIFNYALLSGGLATILIRSNKKIPVFRVTRPYLNLLVKPRILLRFSGKNRILCILKGKMPFNMHNFFFPDFF